VCTDLVVQLVEQGRLSLERIDESVRRILLVKFQLGLFDDPYVDEVEAARVVGSVEFRAAGHRAQAEAITVLKNDSLLPLARGMRVFLDGFRPDVSYAGLEIVTDPDLADVAVIRLGAPFEPRNTYFLEAMTHQGSLDFPPDVVGRVRDLASRVSVVVDVYLDRPAILTPFEDLGAIVVNFGASDSALLDALVGEIVPRGKLPIELPSSMPAVVDGRPDVASDTARPLYSFGHGLSVTDRDLLVTPSGSREGSRRS